MKDREHSVHWEAPEHTHIEKTSDWYWILGILAVSASIASMIFNNVLFGIAILLGAAAMAIVSHRGPRVIEFEISARGIRIGNDLHPYATLESYYLDENNTENPQLILKSKKTFVPLIILAIPEEYIGIIEDIVASRLYEEHLEEPLSHRLLEIVGF
ncbi:MAG: hypothetical protein K9M10_04420 [Candidatus Pacebacteria bacterium]|nr:hypothetical protein [Candidatus Paceibacterota bacterium]MCF7857685.1 hypothetical protein [Candidatus Paceibacterota bacterium]